MISVDKSHLRLGLNCNGAKAPSNTTEFVMICAFQLAAVLPPTWPKRKLLKTAQIAAASASVTTNIAGAWGGTRRLATRVGL